MKRFLSGHATHPQPHMAVALAAAQIEAQRGKNGAVVMPTLGWVYLTDRFASATNSVLDDLRTRWPGVAWVGATGVGIAASGVEYFGEGAVSILLSDMPLEDFRVFSGVVPLRSSAGEFVASTAMVHADPESADLNELVAEMAARTSGGYVFGGVASGRSEATHLANGVLRGGLSGVAFSTHVGLISRMTQGCQPLGPVRRVTATERNLVLTLDHEPALPALLADWGLASLHARDALDQLRATLVGLNDAGAPALARGGQFGADTRVRHLIGIDPARQAIAIADTVEPGALLTYCRRDMEGARRDLVRMCSEIREETEPEIAPSAVAWVNEGPTTRPAGAGEQILGALYVSCAGRGGPHFGGPSAELAIVRHALGDVPLAGFFAAGEIAHRHLYGYTGVLTVFTASC